MTSGKCHKNNKCFVGQWHLAEIHGKDPSCNSLILTFQLPLSLPLTLARASHRRRMGVGGASPSLLPLGISISLSSSHLSPFTWWSILLPLASRFLLASSAFPSHLAVRPPVSFLRVTGFLTGRCDGGGAVDLPPILAIWVCIGQPIYIPGLHCFVSSDS